MYKYITMNDLEPGATFICIKDTDTGTNIHEQFLGHLFKIKSIMFSDQVTIENKDYAPEMWSLDEINGLVAWDIEDNSYVRLIRYDNLDGPSRLALRLREGITEVIGDGL